jgi:NAD(P)-dependent dehydrogenase (short-subunit alcohol dehydrogenase family)
MWLEVMFGLKGKVALVTGAGRGLGREAALALAAAGADVALVSRNREELEGVASDIRGMGCRALPLVVDLADWTASEEIIARVIEHLGRVDILVNNAAVIVRDKFEDVTWGDMDLQIAVNLKTPFALCKAALPHMKDRGTGKIINVTSVGGSRGAAEYSVYSTCKGGLSLMTKSLAVELARDGFNIQANCIAPGSLLTPMNRAAGEADPGHFDFLRSIIPMRRSGEPGEIRGLVVFLASAATSYITGQDFFIDGGATSAWV